MSSVYHSNPSIHSAFPQLVSPLFISQIFIKCVLRTALWIQKLPKCWEIFWVKLAGHTSNVVKLSCREKMCLIHLFKPQYLEQCLVKNRNLIDIG